MTLAITSLVHDHLMDSPSRRESSLSAGDRLPQCFLLFVAQFGGLLSKSSALDGLVLVSGDLVIFSRRVPGAQAGRRALDARRRAPASSRSGRRPGCGQVTVPWMYWLDSLVAGLQRAIIGDGHVVVVPHPGNAGPQDLDGSSAMVGSHLNSSLLERRSIASFSMYHGTPSVVAPMVWSSATRQHRLNMSEAPMRRSVRAKWRPRWCESLSLNSTMSPIFISFRFLQVSSKSPPYGSGSRPPWN